MNADRDDVIQDLLASLPGRGAQDAIVAFAEDGLAEWISYESLAGMIGGFSRNLRERGLGRGSHVAILSENGTPAVVARLALLAIGAIAVNLDPDASIEELRRELKISESSLLLATARLLKSAQDAAGNLAVIVIGRQELDSEEPPYDLRATVVRPDDGAALFFTSGTTGPPKAVPLTRRNVSATITAVKQLALVGAKDCVLLPLPLHHSYPFLVGLLVTLASGAALVLPSALTGPQLLHALRQGRVSAIVGVPRLYEALLQSVESRVRAKGGLVLRIFEAALACCRLVQRHLGFRLGRLLFQPLHREIGGQLRIMASGGARLDPHIAARLEGLGFTVLEGYGLVETASVSTFNPPGHARFGSVGLPAPNVEIRIDEPDREGQGEILIRGPSVFPGYLRDDDATSRAFAPGGWFRSGDIGRLDQDGYLFVTGRLKEIIILPDGKKIAPEELEAAYTASPLIHEIALLETRDGLQALVVPDMTALQDTSASLEAAIRIALSEIGQTLPAYKRLSGFALIREPLPRTHLGKYARRQLPALFEQARRHEHRPSLSMADADKALLDDPLARALWTWLQERFPTRALDLDTSPQIDLGVDSLGWIELSLAIESQFHVRLLEETVSHIVTLRDLVKFVCGAAHAMFKQPPAGAGAIEAQSWVTALGPARTALAWLIFGVAWIAARGLFRLKVYGVENIPADRPLIIAANHASDLDPFMLAVSVPTSLLEDIYWGGDAARLFGTPVRRWVAKTVHVFPVDDRAPAASLARALSILDQGKVLIWFPESWRSPTGDLQRFLPGIGRLIRERETCVLPAYISGSFQALPRYARIPRFRPISVTFGKAIHFVALREAAADSSDTGLAEALRSEVVSLKEETAAGELARTTAVD